MGFFKKAKDAAAGMAGGAPAGGDNMVHVEGASGIDPAILGGPSTKSVAADDPIWAPIEGISLETYANVTKGAQGQGVTDEAGMLAYAASQGYDQAAFKAAMDGWVERMKTSMAVGQQFNKIFMGK